jgi:hypothetical protein
MNSNLIFNIFIFKKLEFINIYIYINFNKIKLIEFLKKNKLNLNLKEGLFKLKILLSKHFFQKSIQV